MSEKTRITFEIDRSKLFDTIKQMNGDYGPISERLIGVFLSGESSFREDLGMAFYGITVAPEQAPTAVWNEAVEACIGAIRSHPAAIGESGWDEGVNDARLEHIKALRDLKRKEGDDA